MAKYNVTPTSYEDIKAQASRLIQKIIKDVQSTILDLMRETKSGRTYWKGKKKTIRHVASAPGQAPAIDTGVLWNSITSFLTRPTVGVIGIGAAYGIFLEEGTYKMEPRPFIEPAFNGVLTKLQGAGVITKFERINLNGKL